MSTFLIGDTHFYHANIIKYCDRPFATVAEMNECIIENWNRTVGQLDTVFVLGDFAFCGKNGVIDIGNKLHGKKTLILGNHDDASIKTYYDAGFEFVSKYPILYKDFYVLSHYPQYIQNNGVYANIFAHVHNNPMYTNFSSRSFCASAERINYTPIDFDEIISKMESVESVQEPEADKAEDSLCPCWEYDRNLNRCVCTGTKEREVCNCAGYQSICDFYPEKRK